MKLEITIPESLADIKLKDYQRFYKETDKIEDDMVISTKIVSIFCNLEESLVGQIPLKEFEEIVIQITKVLQSNNEPIRRFTLHGVLYGLVPKIDNISLAEFVDVDKYVGSTEQLHRAMAVLFRPITNKVAGGMYLIEDYEGSNKLCDIMLDCRMDIVAGMLVFFWTLGNELATHTLNSLEEAQDSRAIQLRQTLEQSGVGINQFMHSLRETLSSSMKLPS